ncbi:hypothetical protein [uncultured Bifidobacterium sp.]|uniref:hypothetical protein n=1 Tax=uncultured Bifidobacterium sp. TaxID=165187 RepID=UPI0025937BE6|nr:hypothetical protein [uncultured Bifidobacterium sp.]
MNVTEEKQRMLGEARKAAVLYARIAGHVTRFACSDGFTLGVRWTPDNFAHLCGLEYFADDRRTRRLPGRRLYVDLLSGKRITPRRVAPTGDARWMSRKADVIAEAFDLESVRIIVESGNSRIRLYMGNKTWCIGVGYDEENGVHYPQSLRKGPALGEKKTGTTEHVVIDMTIE